MTRTFARKLFESILTNRHGMETMPFYYQPKLFPTNALRIRSASKGRFNSYLRWSSDSGSCRSSPTFAGLISLNYRNVLECKQRMMSEVQASCRQYVRCLAHVSLGVIGSPNTTWYDEFSKADFFLRFVDDEPCFLEINGLLVERTFRFWH